MFTSVVRIKSLPHFETYLYSRNESSMIIWRANKAGYIIPGLSSTADSSHNAAAARNEIRFSFFLLYLQPTKLYEHERQQVIFLFSFYKSILTFC